MREIGGYTRTTDKTLDQLFDEACRESLRTHCLDLADSFNRKEQYVKVAPPHPNYPSEPQVKPTRSRQSASGSLRRPADTGAGAAPAICYSSTPRAAPLTSLRRAGSC